MPELAACPGCIAGSSPYVQQGFLWGMLLITAAPAFLLAVIGGGLVRTHRRAMRREVERLLRDLSAAPPVRAGRERA